MPRLLKTCTLHGAFDDAFLPDPFSSSFVFSDDKYFKTLGDEAARRDRITTHNAYHEFLSKKKFNSPHSKDTGPSFRSFNSAGRKPLFPPIVSVDLLKSTRRRPFLTVRSRTKALNKSLYDLPESQSKPRQLSEPSVIERIRWKNAILVYIQFDPWNKGYIDIEEAVDRLREKAKTKDAHPLLHRLISILEDLKAFVSSRGVIEKEVALSAIYRFINEAGLSCPIYGILRGPSQSLMTAFADYGNGFLENEPFYRGSYVPHGVQTQLQDEDEDVAPKKKIESCFLKTPTRDDAVLEPEDVRDYAAGHWGPVDAPLYVHAEVSRARRDQKISLLRQKTDEAFKAAHPFKPALHRKARRMKKSTPASPFEDSAQSFSDEEFMKLRDASSRYKNKKEKADDQAPDTKDRAQKQTLKAPLRVTFDDDDDEDKPLAKTQSPSRLPAPCDRMPLTCKSNRIIAENEKEFDDKAPGHWETLLHYVVHAGEPPPPKAIKWEDSLRVRGMAEAIGNSDNENDVQQCIFDYWSNKETAKKLDKHQNRMSSRFGWTPKLAFTPSTRSARKKKTPKTRKDAAGREVFHRPYVLDHCYCFPEQSVAASKEPLHISLRREALHSLLASTPQGCRETSTAARRAPKQQSSVLQANANESTATARQQRVTSCRLTQKKTSDLFSESPEMDLLLLPQTPEKSYHIDGRNERSAWGDIVTEQKFSSRGASEWIHHLRRGHSNHPIKTSYT